MGLTASIGLLDSMRGNPDALASFRTRFTAVNDVLRAAGLPAHEEPAELPPHVYQSELDSIGWDWLHCLRRLHALVLQGIEPTPPPEDYPPRELDPVLDLELSVHQRSHLIVHSDAQGWYVPIDFPTCSTATYPAASSAPARACWPSCGRWPRRWTSHSGLTAASTTPPRPASTR
jgi:hypothetical protein